MDVPKGRLGSKGSKVQELVLALAPLRFELNPQDVRGDSWDAWDKEFEEDRTKTQYKHTRWPLGPDSNFSGQ